jgi:hypothetical protein
MNWFFLSRRTNGASLGVSRGMGEVMRISTMPQFLPAGSP